MKVNRGRGATMQERRRFRRRYRRAIRAVRRHPVWVFPGLER
jgi:hypothetical protein